MKKRGRVKIKTWSKPTVTKVVLWCGEAPTCDFVHAKILSCLVVPVKILRESLLACLPHHILQTGIFTIPVSDFTNLFSSSPMLIMVNKGRRKHSIWFIYFALLNLIYPQPMLRSGLKFRMVVVGLFWFGPILRFCGRVRGQAEQY